MGTQTQVSPPETRESRGLWEDKARATGRTGQLRGRSEGAAQCFVLITSEMLTWASLGAATGRPARWAVEALLQTVRKTRVSSGGGERASGPGKRTFVMPGGWQESPTPRRRPARGCLACPLAGLAPLPPPVPRTAQPASQVSLLEPPCNGKLLALAELAAHPFRGCPGQPSRRKLLAIPILNTRVMVYGP